MSTSENKNNGSDSQPKLIVIDGITYGGSRPHTPESLKMWESAMADLKNNNAGAVTEEKQPSIVIKTSPKDIFAECALCKVPVELDSGTALFIEGTWDLVCYMCGCKHAPDIAKTLHEAHYAEIEREERRIAFKQELLGRYEKEDARCFWQFDCLPEGPGTDERGYSIIQDNVHHLMNDAFAVRVLIPHRYWGHFALDRLDRIKKAIDEEWNRIPF